MNQRKGLAIVERVSVATHIGQVDLPNLPCDYPGR